MPTLGYNQQLDGRHQFGVDGLPQPHSEELVVVVVDAVDAVIVVGAAVGVDVAKGGAADERQEAAGAAAVGGSAAAAVVVSGEEPFSLPWLQSLSPLVSPRHSYSPWH